ncbi:mannosyltransferase, partial [Candidatus Kuenenbacteria bacterium CG_4_10_14_3_um_filter_39_14]
LFIAIILRLLAAFFSKGFGMHDDHFLVIEASQSWVDGTDYNRWLPSNASTPSGHSWFYVGLHYLLFSILKTIHITEPQTKMLIVRILHAFYSLSIVYFGYR